MGAAVAEHWKRMDCNCCKCDDEVEAEGTCDRPDRAESGDDVLVRRCSLGNRFVHCPSQRDDAVGEAVGEEVAVVGDDHLRHRETSNECKNFRPLSR